MLILRDFSHESAIELKNYLCQNQLHEIKIGCGMPIYNPRDIFEETLLSILRQSEPCLIFITDDSSENTPVIQQLLALHENTSNIIYYRNSNRIGQLLNTKLARDFFISLLPNVSFYFLASDHDVWNKMFVKTLLESFAVEPSAAIAVPLSTTLHIENFSGSVKQQLSLIKSTIRDSWNTSVRKPIPISVLGLTIRSKIDFIKNTLSAGNMIYGLENLEITKTIPYYEKCLGPDRLFLIKAITRGPLLLVEENLWLRVQFVSHERKRQILNLFIGMKKPLGIFRKFPDWHHLYLLVRDSQISPILRSMIGIHLLVKPLRKKFMIVSKRTRRSARMIVKAIMR